MFCRYCGQQIEDDSKFCRYCGKGFENDNNTEPSPSPSRKSNKKLYIIIGSILFVLLCVFCIIVGDDDKSDSYYDKYTSEDEDLKKGGLFDGLKAKDSVKSRITGETLSVKEGQATIITKEELYLEECLALPEFGSYCGNAHGFEEMFIGDKESCYYISRRYKISDIEEDCRVIESYLNLLRDKYGFTYSKTTNSPPDELLGMFIFGWLCTNGDEQIFVEYDGITGYTSYVNMTYYDNMEFVETDSQGNLVVGANAEAQTYNVASSYFTGYNKACAEFYNFGGGSDTIRIYLTPDIIKIGSKFDYSDFETESFYNSAGNIYFKYLYGLTETSTSLDQIDLIKDLEVEVLNISNGYPAIYFYAEIYDEKQTLRYFEGVCAPRSTDILELNNGGNSSNSGSSTSSSLITIPTLEEKDCGFCEGGYQECYFCSDGWVSCSSCNGTGTYSNYGQRVDCSCLNGEVKCSHCDGYSRVKCTYCNGKGTK